MTNDGWSSKPVYQSNKDDLIVPDLLNDIWNNDSLKPLQSATLIGYDLGSGDATVLTKILDGKLVDVKNLKVEGSNLIDDDHKLYFQCDGCQKLLDPDTKSFKTLHDLG